MTCPHPEKVQHRTAAVAKAALASVNRRFRKAGEHVYRCDDHWHIGSDRQSLHNAIQQALRNTDPGRRSRRNRRS